MSATTSAEAIPAPDPIPFREYLMAWAFALGIEESYAFGHPDHLDGHIKEQLFTVRDIVENQDAAFKTLKAEAVKGYGSCYGWSWCLRDRLTPLFERNATVKEINDTAWANRGALPNHAVLSALDKIHGEFELRAFNAEQDRKWRKRG